MRLKHIYLLLFILGVIIPSSQFISFLSENGLDIPLLFHQLFANRISAFFGLDVIISAVVLLVLIFTEGRKENIRHMWIPVLATLAVGVSAGLPLYLYMREYQKSEKVLSAEDKELRAGKSSASPPGY